MNVGLIDVDGHNFPNLALMKLSAWHKARGDTVEWWWGFGEYDRVYMSKVFDSTYSPDIPDPLNAAEVIDWTQPCYSIFATKEEIKSRYGVNAVRPLADNTMRRVIRGVDKFVIRADAPYIVPWTVTNTTNSVGGPVTDPVHTVTSAGNQMLLSPALIQYHTEQSESVRGQGVADPLRTVDASNRYGLIAANLVEYYGNGNPLDITEPMRTITSHDREALTVTHICKFKGQNIGQDEREPLQTVTASAGEFAEIRTEIRTYDSGADMGHWPEIRALLNRFCGYCLKDDEVLLLNVNGAAYFLADIGLRMLTPRELYNAMGFPPDYIIDRDYTGRAYGKSKQVARCGNAVCPPMAEAVVRANLPEWCGKKLRTMEELERAVSA